MNERVITDLAAMDTLDVIDCASAFRTGNYKIVTTAPSTENIPHNLSETLRGKENYRIILDDPNADFSYYSITYTASSGENIIMPIGAYGVSNKKEVFFPLVIYGTWFMLLILDKGSFCKGLNLTEEDDLYFSKFLSWKKELITKIFAYYLELAPFSPTMSWKIKGEKSNTRQIAESLGFHRVVFNDSELYSREKLEENSDLLRYFKNCLFRWDVIGRDKLQSNEISENVVVLISNIVGLTQNEEVPS